MHSQQERICKVENLAGEIRVEKTPDCLKNGTHSNWICICLYRCGKEGKRRFPKML